jgi:hypothetical protein
VVEESALDLVGACARAPESVPDPVGWWFARARTLARSVAGGDDDLPVGGGVLGGDANQVRLAEALELVPERERAALLLRDSYDLPASAVGISLGLDAAAAMEVVGAARLRFLPALLGGSAPSLAGHAVDLAALARLAEGGTVAARDSTTRRHVQSCGRCGDVVDAQERSRRLLSGLTVVALPDAEREGLLSRVEERAHQVLPAALMLTETAGWDDEQDEPHRRYSLSLMALGIVLAAALGVGIGVLASRGGSNGTGPVSSSVPLVTAPPPFVLKAVGSPAPTTPAIAPAPRVFLITPSPTPLPTVAPTASPTAVATTPAGQQLSLQLSPSSGPNDTAVTVTGTGWTPGATLTLTYFDRFGNQPSSTVTATVDPDGRFSTSIVAHDPNGVPGPHDVHADDGSQRADATFTAQ